MSLYQNPFPNDPDRRAIWEMLVERDIQAFVQQDWGRIADDFIADGFMGIDGRGLSNPDGWRLAYSTLDAYRDEWIRQAKITAETEFAEDLEPALIRATTLRDVEIADDLALIHKKFDGSVAKKDGSSMVLNWQTLYHCRKIGGNWKITGFTGYLPHPMGAPLGDSLPGVAKSGTSSEAPRPAKAVPAGASQHVTAGPYSSVLTISPGQLFVIAGQAAIDPDGNVIGDTIEEQARWTLENCRKQMATAGCTFDNVFKVNVYLTDLSVWDRFNVVYRSMMPEPRPVRTAVGTKLLPGLLVEIEMWAVT